MLVGFELRHNDVFSFCILISEGWVVAMAHSENSDEYSYLYQSLFYLYDKRNVRTTPTK